MSDSRLKEQSDLTGGCGGVGILWKKDLSVITLPCPNSSRICAIVGVYMPSDRKTEEYQSCLSTMEEVLNKLCRSQPDVMAGNFNAHIGSLCGPKCKDTSNTHGHALNAIIGRNNLFVASLSEETSGPVYTLQW